MRSGRIDHGDLVHLVALFYFIDHGHASFNLAEDRVDSVEVWLGSEVVATGSGSSKQVAEQMAARFVKEGKAAARLNHPGIVTLYEMGEEDGNALLVTELVDGSTLAELNRELGDISADLAALTSKWEEETSKLLAMDAS